MRKAPFLVALLLVSLGSAPGAAEAKTQDSGYLPHLLIIGISCSEADHTLIPTEPTDPDPHNPVGWLLSGEPECAHADALNKVRETEGEERVPWGFGYAGHWFTEDDAGTLAFASTSDAVFGGGSSFLSVYANSEEGPIASEGCGAQSIVLPVPFPPWQDGTMIDIWWATVSEIGIDEDLTVCFATTGIIHGTWGA